MVKMQLTTMTIDAAINHRSTALWCINNFVDAENRTADVVGECRDPNGYTGQVQPFKIPASWIPQRVSDIAPKDYFLEGSIDFLNAVRRQWLVIVDPQQAEEFLNSHPDARIEADRLKVLLQGHAIGVSSLLRGAEGAETIDLDAVRNRASTGTANIPEGTPTPTEHEVKPVVMQIMAREDEPASKLNALKSIPTLRQADLDYIHVNTADQSILAWLSDQKPYGEDD